MFKRTHTCGELGKKDDKKAGRLRFKNGRSFKTFTYNQSGFKIIRNDLRHDKLHLAKIDDIPFSSPSYTMNLIAYTIVDRVKYGQTSGVAMIDTSELAGLFKVDRVLISRGIKNSGLEAGTASHGFIVGKDALLVYAATSPGILQPSAGYTFSWAGQVGSGPEGNRIKRYHLDEYASDVIELEIAFDMKLISADLGAFWDGVVA